MKPIDVTNLFPIEDVWWRRIDKPSRITDIAVHHTAGFYLLPNATQEEEINHLRMIHQYHISRGFGGIGYHCVVFPSGRTYKTCDYNRWGANVYLENDSVLGISAVGTFNTYIPQEIQLDGMGYGILDFWDYLNKEVICRPHRYWGGTTCPGTRYKEWVPGLVNRARALKEDNMPLNNEDKEYLGGLMRGLVLALGTGGMNSPMRTGDPKWMPPVTLKAIRRDIDVVKAKVSDNYNRINEGVSTVLNDVLAAIEALPQTTIEALSETDKQAIAKAAADEFYKRMKE